MLAQQDPIGWTAALLLMIGVGLVMIGAGWLVISIANRAADGRLGANRLAGVRTRTTLSSDEAWLAAHQVSQRPTVLGGYASIGSAIAAIVFGLVFGGGDAELATLIWTVIIMVGGTLSVGLVLYGAWLGQKAAKAVDLA